MKTKKADRIRILGGVLAAAMLAACSGHSAPVMPVANPVPAAKSAAKFSISVPLPGGSSAVKPAYVSPNTKSLAIGVTSVNGTAPSPAIPIVVVSLTTANPNCSSSSGTLTCTASDIVPSGNVTFSISTYASTDGTGAALSTASVAATVVAGASTNVPVTLDGVPVSLSFGGSTVSAYQDGNVHTITLTVNAKDASGATIVGPGNYSTPIDLAISGDPNGALSLSTSSITSPASNQVTLTYATSVQLSTGVITATASGAASASVNVVPMASTPAQLLNPGLIPSVATYTFSVSELNYSGAFTISGATSAVSVTCNPSNCTPSIAGSPVSITVTPLANGGGSLSISDANGGAISVPYHVSAPQSTYVMTSGINSSTGLDNEFEALTGDAGSDGNVWVEEYGSSNTEPSRGLQFAQISPSGTLLNDFYLPSSLQTNAYNSVVQGPDNAMWFVSGFSYIGRISTAAADAGTITAYPVTITGVPNPDPTTITLGSDGNLWFAEQSGYLGRITPSGTISQINLTNGTQYPSYVTSGPDGNLWVETNKSTGAGQIDRVTTSGTVTSFPLPNDAAGNPYIVSGGMVTGSDGNLWFLGEAYDTLNSGLQQAMPAICKLTTSGAYTCTGLPSAPFADAAVQHIVRASDGSMWFSIQPQSVVPDDYIVRFDTSATAYFYAFPYSGSGGQPAAMSLLAGPDHNLWYGLPNFNEMVKLTP